jgi:hypothetical protein
MSKLPNIQLRSKRSAVIVAVMAAAVAAGSVAALAGESAAPDLTVPSTVGVAPSIPAELSSAFSFLRGPKQSADILSGAAASGLKAPGGVAQHYGVNTSLARLAGAPGGLAVWLVPGSTGSCIALATGAGACGSNAAVTDEGLVVAVIPTDGTPASVYGVVPDNGSVTETNARGTTASVPMSGPVFSVTAADAASFAVHTASGRTLARPLPAPPATGPSN